MIDVFRPLGIFLDPILHLSKALHWIKLYVFVLKKKSKKSLADIVFHRICISLDVSLSFLLENNKIDITLVLFLRRELYNLANGYFCVGGFHTGYQRGKILQYFCKKLFFIRQLCRLRLLLRLLLLSHAHALEANREFQ